MDQSIANYIIGPHMSTFTQSPDAVSIPKKPGVPWGPNHPRLGSQLRSPPSKVNQGLIGLERARVSLRAVHHAQCWTDFLM